MSTDKQREAALEQARQLRQKNLEIRKATAMRVLGMGGTMEEAAKASKASPDTVKKWIIRAWSGK